MDILLSNAKRIIILLFCAVSALGQQTGGPTGGNTTAVGVGSTNQITGAFVDAAAAPYYIPGVTQDMCAAVAASTAAAGVATKNPSIYIGGFSGVQFCSAANATTMFLGLTHGGDVYLGRVHLYIDGPCANLACASGYSFNDGDSGGSAPNQPGTPAILVPDRTAIHGMGRRGAGNFNTVIDICVTGSYPAAGTTATSFPLTPKDTSGCVNTYPQRSWLISSTSFSSGTGCTAPCGTLTITLSNNGTSCGASCAVSTSNAYANEPFFIAGAAVAGNNIAGQVQTVAANTVTVQTANAATCASSCGTLYLSTPIIAFANGNVATTPYVTATGNSAGVYAPSLEGIGLNGESYLGADGAHNNFGNEHTHIDNLFCGTIVGFCYASWGNQAQNGGSFDNFESDPGSTNCGQWTGFLLFGGPSGMSRGVHNGTFNAVNCNATPWAGIYVETSKIDFYDEYSTGVVDGILIGDQGKATAISMTGVTCGTSLQNICTNTVHISSANANSDIVCTGCSGVGSVIPVTVKNDISGCSSGAGLGAEALYAYDNNGAGKVQEFSSSDACPTRSGGGFSGPIVSFGNLPACAAATESIHAVVTNAAIACTLNSAAAGAGTHRCEVYCNNNAGTFSWVYDGVGQ